MNSTASTISAEKVFKVNTDSPFNINKILTYLSTNGVSKDVIVALNEEGFNNEDMLKELTQLSIIERAKVLKLEHKMNLLLDCNFIDILKKVLNKPVDLGGILIDILFYI